MTVIARVSSDSSRHAMPSIPELVYAALLYKDGEIPANPESKDFVQGTETENGKLIFSFQRPDDTSGTFTLEIFAFVKTDVMAEGESTSQFSRETALLSGYKDSLEIDDDSDEIKVTDPIALSSEKQGTVSLKIKVPADCSLEINDTTNFNCKKDEASPDTYVLTQKGASGISAGAYQVQFTVKKGTEIIHIFSEYINVINGLCTDTWSGLEKDEAKEITQSMISSTVYVRGTGMGGWYDGSDYKDTATASDTNSGSFLAPLATIQKAVEKIIAINDGDSAYTIYVDGTFTATSSAALADFSSLSQPLNIKIAGLSASNKAVLDGKNSARGIVVGASGAQKDVNLTLENLILTGGNTSDNGGGIYFGSADGTLTISNGTEIKGNTASGDGGGIYVNGGTLTMTGGNIGEENATNAAQNGGGIYVNGGTFTLTAGAISGNKAEGETGFTGQGGGIYLNDATFTMSGGTVSKNKAVGDSENSGGGGIYVYKSTFEMSGGTFSGNEAENGKGHGAFISPDGGILKMSGSAQFADDNDIYLHTYSGATLPTVQIAGDLATTPVATITPSAYTEGMQVLSGAAATLAANCGKFEVSQAGWKIDEEGKLAVAPDIYVSEGGDDTNGKGSQAKPFATLQKAFDLIQTLNLSTVSYIVHISGTVKGKSELSADVSAQKISITGTTGAKLDGNQALTTLLTVSCSAPVEVTNITLTNNRESAIYVKSDANVTLGEGAAVLDNSLKPGVDIVSGGTFTMKSGATISENKIRTAGVGGGGGVRNKGTFIMEGGTISGNYVSPDKEHGGGVYSSGTFIMKGGEISGNYTSTTYSTGNGGGVYIAGGTFEMTGGTISGNRASSAGKGGGVYVSSGTFTMGGSASIPAGDDGKNDVYLASGKKITIAGALSKTEVATITLPDSAYAAGTQVLSVDGVSLYESTCDKFALTPYSDGMEWKIAPGEGNTAGVLFRSAFYVRGSGAGWYAENPAFTASAGNDTTGDGTKTKPFATIQKAIDEVIAQNNGSGKRTIYVDGTLTQSAAPSGKGMADFSASEKDLTLTITALSETTKATLDANQRSRVIYAYPNNGRLYLTMKNLVITKGRIYMISNDSRGGGIYFSRGELTIDGCTISGNIAVSGGSYTSEGGGIYTNGDVVMNDCIISGNTAESGGGVYIGSSRFTMNSGTISDNEATDGGGVYAYCNGASSFTMKVGTITSNRASGNGGGVYDKMSKFTQNGGTVSGNTPDNVYTP